MSNKLSEVQARMNGVHGLESVVGAMRGIAAARSREARSRLDGIRACAQIVGAAIGDALLLIDDPASHKTAAPDRDAKRDAAVVIVLCAEQGCRPQVVMSYLSQIEMSQSRLIRTMLKLRR